MNKMFLKDNKGFSLIELIVTVLITALLMLGVLTFMTTSRNVYQGVNTSATLQEEAMTVERVLSEFIMEAKPGYASDGSLLVASYGYDKNVSAQVTVDTETETRTLDVFWINAKENKYDAEGVSGSSDDDSLYFFVFDHTDNKLRYCKIDSVEPNKYVGNGIDTASDDQARIKADGINKIKADCYGSNEKFSMIAEHLETMELKKTVAQADGTDLVILGIKYEYLGKSYTDTLTVVTRNQNVHTTPEPDPDEG